jgi:hypothetical protein
MKYLGLSVSDKTLSVADWHFLTKQAGHRVDPWKGLFLASVGRLELMNSCLEFSNVCNGTLLTPCRDARRHESVEGSLIFGRSGYQTKIPYGGLGHCVYAQSIWGLGILNSKHTNIALMLKWVWKLYQDGEGLWTDLLRAKYLGIRTCSPC